MGRSCFELLPQILDRIVIRGIGGQLNDTEPMLMGLVELLHRGAGVIASPIVNENERLLGLSEDGGQELLVGRRAESLLDSLGEETTGAVFDGAEDLVAFGFTGGLPTFKDSTQHFGHTRGESDIRGASSGGYSTGIPA